MKFTSAEAIGIKSQYIENFLDVLEENNICMHSFMLLRDGKVGAEGYWKPFTKDMPHRLYSSSKSFVGIAIVGLVDEGKISLDDKIIKFFPDIVPDNIHPYLAETTVRNLLMMATPYSNPTYDINDKDWLKSYFTSQPDHPSGTIFRYDSCGSYILGSIVKRVTGKPFMEYLDEKVFQYIGFEKGRRCLEGPDGESWAGSGVIITTREFAAFANFLMNKGNVNGKQIISKHLIEEACSNLINTRIDGCDYRYHCGYGYQIWVTRDNAFHFSGRGGQIVLGFPDTGLIFVCTAQLPQPETVRRELLFNALWNEIITKLEDNLPEDENSDKHLKERCKNLKLQLTDGKPHSDIEDTVNGVTYKLFENKMKISNIKLSFDNSIGKLYYQNPRGDKEITFGMGHFKEDLFPEEHYPGERLLVPAQRKYKTANSGMWIDKNTLLIRIYTVDDFIGALNIVISFKGDEIAIYMRSDAQFFFGEYNGFAGGVKI